VDIRAHVIDLNTEVAKLNHQLNAHWDTCLKAHPGQPMSAEERVTEDRIVAEIAALTNERDRFVAQETREQESAKISETFSSAFGSPAPAVAGPKSETQQLEDFLRGRSPGNAVDEKGARGFHVDFKNAAPFVDAIRDGASSRDIRNTIQTTTGSGSLLMPTDLAATIYAFMTASVAMMRMPTTKINTSGGNPIDFPRVSTHGVGTNVLEATTVGGTDAAFAKMTLNAYKYGQLVKLSSETIADDGVDIIGFVAENVARATGELIGTDLVTGSGSSLPNGIMTAITNAAVNGGTVHGVIAGITYEDLVTCAYRVNSNYRNKPSCGWLMADITAGSLRKLRDGAGGTVGAVLWQPSLTAGIQGGEPDRLIGHPVWTDPNVASVASTNKVVAFGDWAAYYIRQAGGFRFERSDEFAFGSDEVTFRGLTRIDGDVIDIGRAFNGIRVV
jgi:HK97 family phage major capsid protein